VVSDWFDHGDFDVLRLCRRCTKITAELTMGMVRSHMFLNVHGYVDYLKMI
jgi:hypothetical protein